MTCLTVSSTIHPISAPTGTDADMGGNDKRKPSDVCDTNNLSRLQRDFFLDPTLQVRIPFFMTPPGAECTIAVFEKHRVWLRRKSAGWAQPLAEDGRARVCGKVTHTARLQSAAMRISWLRTNYRSFLGS